MKLKSWIVLGAAALFLLFNYRRLIPPTRKPNLLRIAHTFTTASERQIIDEAIIDFEATHAGIRIEQNVSNSEVYNTIGWRLQFRSRTPPDIYFQWEGFKTDEAIKRGWALDLVPYFPRNFRAQFVTNAIPSESGPVYFLPQSFDISNLVWFNRALFDQLNLHPPQSLEDWLNICRRLRGSGYLPLGQGNRDLWPMGNFGAELLAQALGPARYATLFTSHRPASVPELAPLRTLAQMHNEQLFDWPGILQPSSIKALHDIDAKVLFLNGKCAQHIVGSWFFADVQDAQARNELLFPIDLFPVPSQAAELDATTAVATGYLVHPSTQNPQAAVAFLELLLSRKYQARFAQLGHLSSRRDAADFISHPLTRRLWNILAQSRALVPPPDTGFRPEQAMAFYRICGRLVSGELGPDRVAEAWSAEKQNLALKGL